MLRIGSARRGERARRTLGEVARAFARRALDARARRACAQNARQARWTWSGRATRRSDQASRKRVITPSTVNKAAVSARQSASRMPM